MAGWDSGCLGHGFVPGGASRRLPRPPVGLLIVACMGVYGLGTAAPASALQGELRITVLGVDIIAVDAGTAEATSTGGLVNPVACLVRPAATGDGMYEIAIVWQGLTQLPNQNIPENANASLCGTTDGSYDAGSSNNNLYRRVHWQEIFLDV